MSKDKVYIILKGKVVVDVSQALYIRDVGLVYADNESLQKKIEGLKVYNGLDYEDWDYIDANTVRKKLLEKHNDLFLEITGERDVKIEVKSKEENKPFLQFLKVVAVCLIMFFGAGLSIIYFHEDVNMVNALDRL